MKIFQKIQQIWNRQDSVRAGMTDGQMDRGTNGLLIVECHAGSEGSGESAHLHGLARALSQYRNLKRSFGMYRTSMRYTERQSRLFIGAWEWE